MGQKAQPSENPSPKHYEKIGHFVVCFEQVINMMRTCVLILLEKYGLNNERIGLAVTADLNAGDVLGILRSASGIYLEENPDAHLTVVRNVLLKEIQERLRRRNELLHGFWLDKEPSHSTSPSGYRFTKTKEGISLKRLPTLDELEDDIAKANSLFIMIRALTSIFRGTAAPDLYRAFKITGSKNKKLHFDVQFAKSVGFRDPA